MGWASGGSIIRVESVVKRKCRRRVPFSGDSSCDIAHIGARCQVAPGDVDFLRAKKCGKECTLAVNAEETSSGTRREVGSALELVDVLTLLGIRGRRGEGRRGKGRRGRSIRMLVLGAGWGWVLGT